MFYGWWIVGASAIIALFSAGAVFYGFTAIFEPIADEFGWSYTQISLATSLRGLEAGMLAPVVGILVDRLGPRRLIFAGTIIYAAGLFIVAHTTSLGMFYAGFLVIATGLSATSTTVLTTSVVNWFRARLGLAVGVVMVGGGSGGLLIPVMVRLIDAYSWRNTLNILAVATLAISLPLSLLFRHKPEHYGYLPDGEIPHPTLPENRVAPVNTTEPAITSSQALKTGTLWHIAVAFACHGTMLAAVVTHIMPYLSSIGVPRSTSSIVATLSVLISNVGRIGLGWLGDKFNRERVMAVSFGLMGLGLLCLGSTSLVGTWMVVPFLMFFGIGFGGVFAGRGPLTRSFFGREYFGSIFGMLVGISVLGGVVGPLTAGWVFDTWGKYQSIWFIFAVLAVVASVSVLTIPQMQLSARDGDDD